MAFNYLLWQRLTSGYNPIGNAFWNYTDTLTAIATITAANFFDPVNNLGESVSPLQVGDLIWIVASDVLDGEFAQVTAISPHVTVALYDVNLGAGAVGTNNIANQAVTAAKIANNTITPTQMAVNGVTSAALALNTIQYVQVAMTAAQFNGMYAAPFQILAAPAAGLIYQVDNVWYDMAFVSAQYANGGVVNLQYDSTANGAGVPVTADTAAATITGLAASSIVRPGLATAAMAQATTVAKGLFMSTKTAAFITGDNTWKINVAYRVITA
jgi:hypothetical protein